LKKWKFIEFFVNGAFFFVLICPVHEWFHYQVGVWLGGEGFYVTYPDLITGLCNWQTLPEWNWVVYLAGGLGTGILLLIRGLMAWKTPTRWDEDVLFWCFFFGGWQLGYGIAEVSLVSTELRSHFWYLATAGSFLGCLPIAAWRAKPLLDWFLTVDSGKAYSLE